MIVIWWSERVFKIRTAPWTSRGKGRRSKGVKMTINVFQKGKMWRRKKRRHLVISVAIHKKKMSRYSTTYSMTSSTTVISLHALRYQYKYGSPIGPCHYCITIITHGSTLLSGTMENQNMGTRHRLNTYSSGHQCLVSNAITNQATIGDTNLSTKQQKTNNPTDWSY